MGRLPLSTKRFTQSYVNKWRSASHVARTASPGRWSSHKGRAHREVNIARQQCEVACLDGYILRQRAVAKATAVRNPAS
jgi:Pyruvate/2-oxoacid:ferredoxin oxidoreductase delta subunit